MGKSLDESEKQDPESTDVEEDESTTSGDDVEPIYGDDVEPISGDEKAEADPLKVTEEEPSKTESVDLRIVGGNLAGQQSWPFAVALHRDGKFVCGATIIAPQWIATAGHCLHEYDTKKYVFQVYW